MSPCTHHNTTEMSLERSFIFLRLALLANDDNDDDDDEDRIHVLALQ